jgi:hypothetical protein
VTMKNAVFWDVVPLVLVWTDVSEECTASIFPSCSYIAGCFRLVAQSAATCSCWFTCRFFDPEDGGDSFLRNVGSHKIYMAQHPRRQHSSYYLIIKVTKICMTLIWMLSLIPSDISSSTSFLVLVTYQHCCLYYNPFSYCYPFIFMHSHYYTTVFRYIEDNLHFH